MKLKCMVYPYSFCFYPVLQEMHEKSTEFQITILVSPRSWIGKERMISVGDTQIDVSSDFTGSIETVDMLMIADCNDRHLMYSDIVKKMSAAMQLHKKVVCCFPLKEEDHQLLLESSNKYNGEFTYLPQPAISRTSDDIRQMIRLHHQDAVIVGVCNMLQGMNNNHVVVALSEELKRIGYSVVSVTTNFNGLLLGYVEFPGYIFTGTFCESEKIYYFNQFVHEVEIARHPDIIVIEVPDGPMKYSHALPNGFGINGYLISNAIDIDYFILNVPIDFGSHEMLESLNTCLLGRYGCKLDAVAVQNVYLDGMSEDREEICLCPIDEAIVDEYVQELKETSQLDIFILKTHAPKEVFEQLAQQILTVLENAMGRV